MDFDFVKSFEISILNWRKLKETEERNWIIDITGDMNKTKCSYHLILYK